MNEIDRVFTKYPFLAARSRLYLPRNGFMLAVTVCVG
jgi:hypothetical protein